ncbi:hypothetical protein EDC14_1005174 [Hydrogenispora ethanolica]|uniref:Uncharacterized protein n=1 Tax=Hydrogenispora ethanolica TaxID=1082276 RepID=A0A4R1S4J8_HYDET|nr:hypothetical protein [Hydrogenispora ethanolica]TCL73312.1 hypothetical protein EDC14_1005174 [Hydrogenispora ethanolica]
MHQLLRAEGILAPSCNQSHIIYELYLEHPLERLGIDFRYDPKTLEDPAAARRMIEAALRRYLPEEEQPPLLADWRRYLPLQNLLTLSLDDAAGFRGCAHRHSPRQRLELSADRAAPGFSAGPIPAGRLRITLSVHALLTASCHYQLLAWEGGADDEPVALL